MEPREAWRLWKEYMQSGMRRTAYQNRHNWNSQKFTLVMGMGAAYDEGFNDALDTRQRERKTTEKICGWNAMSSEDQEAAFKKLQASCLRE